ncbi:NAD(P)H-binding protein [Aquimarina rhabdastrellae]
MRFTAIILGATGLTGSHLVRYLIEDTNCKELKLITRRKTNFNHPKITECIIDFNNTHHYLRYIKGDVLFSSLGTTLKQAGSKQQQRLVDYMYQYQAAKCGVQNGVTHYVLVSSPWAKINTVNYYRKMKAELEEQIKLLPFKTITFIKPNGLLGQRTQKRLGEKLALPLFLLLSKLFPSLQKHQPIKAKLVAKAMLNSFYKKNQTPIVSYSRNEVLTLSNWDNKLSTTDA